MLDMTPRTDLFSRSLPQKWLFSALVGVLSGALLGCTADTADTADTAGSAHTADTAQDTGTSQSSFPEAFVSWSNLGEGDFSVVTVAYWTGSAEHPSSVLMSSELDICETMAGFASTYESIVDGTLEAGGTVEEGRASAQRAFFGQLQEPWSLLRLKLGDAPGLDDLDPGAGVGVEAVMATRDQDHVDHQGQPLGDLSVFLSGSSDVERMAGEFQGEFLLEGECPDTGFEDCDWAVTLWVSFAAEYCSTEYVPL